MRPVVILGMTNADYADKEKGDLDLNELESKLAGRDKS